MWFAHIHGYKVELLQIMEYCSQNPHRKVHTLSNYADREESPLSFAITGFMVGKAYEVGGIAKDGEISDCGIMCKCTKIHRNNWRLPWSGKLWNVWKSIRSRFLFMCSNSRISVMGGPQAADVLTTVKQDQRAREGIEAMQGDELEAFRARFLKNMKPKEALLFYSKAVG